jgi:hypothetical protein
VRCCGPEHLGVGRFVGVGVGAQEGVMMIMIMIASD